MSIADAVKSLQGSLTGVAQHLPALEDARSQRATAEAELRATVEQRDAANVELKRLNDVLSNAKQQASVEMEAARNAKANELHDLQIKIEGARSELSHLQEEVNAKRIEHDQILASFESLKKRLG